MKEHVHIGSNRTGIQMSPLDSKRMMQVAEKTPTTPMTDFSQSEFVKIRQEYIQESDDIGSVPPPGSLKGMASTGAELLQGIRPEAFIDKLGERLAFERTGARLYESVITKCQAAGVTEILTDLMRIHQEELEHFEIVKNAIEQIGADPTAVTPCADANGVTAMGLLQVAADPRTTVTQSLQTLLMAELTDNAGWELLIEMARKANMDAMADKFEAALSAEEEHLMTITSIYKQMNFDDMERGEDKSSSRHI
ncbi:ferritin-like domain-containing protein [Bdellovibrio bacteriovorus]|uniref:ferritin-like domain-containing protein n=1 Tax=Bdellovibrio bacteriovorus TaxID=959 RepID=UPI000A4FB722|nr:ferritin-like domain-containing protein [Bdellovibrio bacteriovorus]